MPRSPSAGSLETAIAAQASELLERAGQLVGRELHEPARARRPSRAAPISAAHDQLLLRGARLLALVRAQNQRKLPREIARDNAQ